MYVERNTDTLMKFHKDRFSFRNHSINERCYVSEKKFSLIIKHKKKIFKWKMHIWHINYGILTISAVLVFSFGKNKPFFY